MDKLSGHDFFHFISRYVKLLYDDAVARKIGSFWSKMAISLVENVHQIFNSPRGQKLIDKKCRSFFSEKWGFFNAMAALYVPSQVQGPYIQWKRVCPTSPFSHKLFIHLGSKFCRLMGIKMSSIFCLWNQDIFRRKTVKGKSSRREILFQ